MAEQEQEEQDGYLSLGVDVRIRLLSFLVDVFNADEAYLCDYIGVAE